MGLFNFFKGGNNPASNQPTPQTTDAVKPGGFSGLNMNKEQAVQLLNMRKETVNLLCMEKSELSGIKARVGVAMDYSGSMSHLYNNGVVQDTIERLLPIALKFDDNGELDAWLFEDGYTRLETVTADNFYKYVEKKILSSGYDMGGTNYAPVMEDIMKKYMEEDPSNIPTYIIFVTDGDNWDKKETEKVIRESAEHNIFWQFVGIGHESFDFLKKLDDLKGRKIDNTDFFAIKEIHTMPDSELYNNLLNEYPGWEKEAKRLGILK